MTDLLIDGARIALRRLLLERDRRTPALAEVRDVAPRGAAGPLRGRLYVPMQAHEGEPVLVYFHGGGFVVCDVDTHDALCRRLAASSGLRVLSAGYRLAPEHHYPAQLDDALAVCRWVLGGAGGLGPPDRIVLAGDSAGAWLAAMSALRLEAERPGTVPFQLLLYPLVHLDDGLWRREVFRSLRIVGRVAAGMIAERLGAPAFPSLLIQDLALSPPTFLVAGRHDPVRPDVEAYAAALAVAGVPVETVIDGGLLHGSLNLTHLSGAARRALVEAGRKLGAAVRREADTSPLAAGDAIL